MVNHHGRRAERPSEDGNREWKARLINVRPRHAGKPEREPGQIVPVAHGVPAHGDIRAFDGAHGVDKSGVKQLAARVRVKREENGRTHKGFGTLDDNLNSMTWEPALYDALHSYVSDYGRNLVDLLAPKTGERILDLGCGTGTLTHEIAQSGASVIGIDSSPEMIGQARQNYPKLDFRLADVRRFIPSEQFDAVFSNAVLHWVQPPED